MGNPVTFDQLIELDGPNCVWPRCTEPAVERAHFHSKGMGGTPDGRRDSIENQGGMCHSHARISDGEYGSGGRAQYVEAHNILFGGMWPVGWEATGSLAWERAEALMIVVAEKRGWAGG
ncbi:MAG: hypothetical protein ABIJ75_07905 [Actinomycetota bacterium]